MGLFSATEVDTDEIARRYRALLVDGEEVLIAFKTIRDIAFLTDRRLCLVNIQGWIGKKVAIQSIPYRSIVRFSLETAGTFDLEADMVFWLSGSHEPLEIKIGRGSNLAAIQQILARGIFGGR
jgi:hypothetical protein